MPVLPVCLLEPVWEQVAALLPEHPPVSPSHSLGCHRRRVPDRVVVEHVVAALVHGSGYERVATPGCSDRTIRRRVQVWAAAGAMEQLRTRALLAELGFTGVIARKGVPAPIQAGTRWVAERTHAWLNGYGKLRRGTEKRQAVVDFYLFFAAALVVVRQLIQRARTRYRWPTRPTTRRLK